MPCDQLSSLPVRTHPCCLYAKQGVSSTPCFAYCSPVSNPPITRCKSNALIMGEGMHKHTRFLEIRAGPRHKRYIFDNIFWVFQVHRDTQCYDIHDYWLDSLMLNIPPFLLPNLSNSLRAYIFLTYFPACQAVSFRRGKITLNISISKSVKDFPMVFTPRLI